MHRPLLLLNQTTAETLDLDFMKFYKYKSLIHILYFLWFFSSKVSLTVIKQQCSIPLMRESEKMEHFHEIVSPEHCLLMYEIPLDHLCAEYCHESFS